MHTVISGTAGAAGKSLESAVDWLPIVGDSPADVQVFVVLFGGGLYAVVHRWLQIKRPVWRANGFARVRKRYGDLGDQAVNDALALEDTRPVDAEVAGTHRQRRGHAVRRRRPS
jgi:hypothetical protein